MLSTVPQKALDEPFGEVVSSINEMVIAQCYKETISNKSHKHSIFKGSMVKVISSYDSSYVAYGIIAKINNTSLDNIHKPSALGLSFKELTELQPQVYELLRLEIEVYLFAHIERNKQILHFPPLKPMSIHDFVANTSEREMLELTENFSNLISVLKKNQLKPDILIDLITTGYKLRNCDYNYLIKAGQELSLSFHDEIESLMLVLKRLSATKEFINKK